MSIKATIRGALDLLADKLRNHDYGPTFSNEEAYRFRMDALQRVSDARDWLKQQDTT